MGNLENAYVAISEIRNTKLPSEPEVTKFLLLLLYSILGNADQSFKQYSELKDIWGINKLSTSISNHHYAYKHAGLRKDLRYIDMLKELKLYNYWKDDPEIKKLKKGK